MKKIVSCPLCRRILNQPIKFWSYGIFRVESFRCLCGLHFREYSSISLTLDEVEGSRQIEKRSFKLVLQNGKWKKATKVQ